MAIICPKCHRPFTRELESEKILDETESVGEKMDTSIMGARDMTAIQNRVNPSETLGEIRSVPVAEVSFEEHYRCKRCGHEWTEIKKKEGVVDEK